MSGPPASETAPRDSPPASVSADFTRLNALAPYLRSVFLDRGFDSDTLLAVLGENGNAALHRGEPIPVRRAARDAGELGVLIRLLLTGEAVPYAEAAAALAPIRPEDAVDAGLLAGSGDDVVAALDVRPIDFGAGTRWMLSDPDGSMRPHRARTDHVPGVGQASLSLLRAAPVTDGQHVLDIGTGCGVQAIHAAGPARSVTGTDVNRRALGLARASCALNAVDVELLEGSWFEPVRGRRFDRIVANPPFVVGRGTVGHTYRDSGLPLDGAGRLMLESAPRHLAPDGIAAMLVSWVHRRGEDWRSRLAGWLPDHGVDAWAIQRDVADPALYVGTWMRDGGLDPADPAHADTARDWLEHLEDAGVEGIGFGYVYLKRTDESTSLTAEELPHPFDDPLGSEAPARFARMRWLESHEVAHTRFSFAPSAALERVLRPLAVGLDGAVEPRRDQARPTTPPLDDAPWRQVAVRLHRTDGPRWCHELDETSAALLTGLGTGEVSVGQASALLAAATGASPAELGASIERIVTDLFIHGLLVPIEEP